MIVQSEVTSLFLRNMYCADCNAPMTVVRYDVDKEFVAPDDEATNEVKKGCYIYRCSICGKEGYSKISYPQVHYILAGGKEVCEGDEW